MISPAQLPHVQIVIVIGLAHGQLLEEDVTLQLVKVLSGMHEYILASCAQFRDNLAQMDDFRARSKKR